MTLELLDRLAPAQLDPGRSAVAWTQKGNLNSLEVFLRHRVEPDLNFLLTLTDVSATLHHPHRTPDEFSQELDDWPTGLLVEVEQQLRRSYVIEQTYLGARRLRTVLRTPAWTSVSGGLSPLAAIAPRRFLRVETCTADYGARN